MTKAGRWSVILGDANAKPPVEMRFSTCGACRKHWATWNAFLEDPGVTLVGLQVAEHVPDSNLLIFEHACGSSVSVRTTKLRFLQAEEPPDSPTTIGPEECEQRCTRLQEWKTCDRPCVNARARRVLQRILRVKEEQAGR